MAAEYNRLNSAIYQADTTPLLMDQNAVNTAQEHIAPIPLDSSETRDKKSTYPTNPPESISIAIDPPSASGASTSNQVQGGDTITNNLARSSSTSSHLQLIPVTNSSRRSRSSVQEGDVNEYGPHRRRNPLNSAVWISIELAITVSQVIASIIVLALSRDEKPKAPLDLWIIGYAGGCLAMLPFLYWRYTHRHVIQQNPESLVAPTTSSTENTNPLQPSHSLGQDNFLHAEESTSNAWNQTINQDTSSTVVSRTAVRMERFKIALDCFFAVWFVVGNVWIFGGHTSSQEAPNLYRLCIVFLTFSCISYAMPFIICATVCCCLPCIITLLSYREDNVQAKGAAPEVIEALPVYKFKTKEAPGKVSKDEQDSDSESIGEGGIFAPGTEKERIVSGEDAVCCICLGVYKDGVDLKELSCSHFFHVECVDKWLAINASCPLCKHELGSGSEDQQEP